MPLDLWTPQIVRSIEDFTTAVTTLRDVTGLSFELDAYSIYRFDYLISFTSPSLIVGVHFALGGPTSPKWLAALLTVPVSLSAVAYAVHRGYDEGGPTSGIDMTQARTPAVIEGMIETGVDSGTLKVRFASGLAGTTVRVEAGSSGLLYKA